MVRYGRETRLWLLATALCTAMMTGLAACGGDARLLSFPGPTPTASGVPAQPTPTPDSDDN